MHTSKYVVVGAGLAGAATAWRLAGRGHEVTVLERSTPANEWGSSHGSARIFRYAYPELEYTRMVVDAKEGWDELERLGGRRLITPTGAVDHGSVRHPRQLAEVLQAVGVEHEVLPPEEAQQRWPQLAFDTEVLWHPGAGVIDAETTVSTMIELAVAHGAQVRTGWELREVTRSANGFRLSSSTGEVVEAERIIVCAGGWLPALLGDLSLPAALRQQMPSLQVRQEQAYHFPYREVPEPSATPWPTFIHKSENMQAYGLPGGRDAQFHGQKVAQFNGGKILSSAQTQDQLMDEANRQRVVDYAERYLPGVVPEPYAETTCLFTNTPNEDFVLDTVDNITVVSPCSGHGGKFAPLIGEMAADLATGRAGVPEIFRVFNRDLQTQ
ncbi:FAD-dependent oxidoreductase [Kocuria nitroreducens]|uniref:FAD-dependent oxidoreductase n=1 Tax=Kocuria nitroreducens TaxID=3058914 RepID=UPI0036DDCFED